MALVTINGHSSKFLFSVNRPLYPFLRSLDEESQSLALTLLVLCDVKYRALYLYYFALFFIITRALVRPWASTIPDFHTSGEGFVERKRLSHLQITFSLLVGPQGRATDWVDGTDMA
ncbi:uncharacterized protein EDB93DRAFT_1255976 [Suillus bovinus]|uniref:uncharacterized protein n=1 Tax=Suillus bovinus TaxID=48563 RepID=UPI001B87E75D|nr:uncharacterized protein EDB93DRAFT_1255976 [Suillus bovinus]KAG2130306.1 hypothetical protein EDB93DRAFT_1255976 [Suillus bovinus]